MKFKSPAIVTAIIILFEFPAYCQNFVQNAGFEDTMSCVVWLQIHAINSKTMPCSGWFQPTNGTCDFFSEAFCGNNSFPNNFGSGYARTGIDMMGLVPYNAPYNLNYREYISGILSDSLISGHQYNVSFFIKPASYCKQVVSEIGLYLSEDSLIDYSINTNFTVIPQIQNTSGMLLNDTSNWTEISGIYTATGGEKFLTIGNFNDDTHTTVDSFAAPLQNEFPYYFIDDVSVTDLAVNAIDETEGEITVQSFISEKLQIRSNIQIAGIEVYNVTGERIMFQNIEQKQCEIFIYFGYLPSCIYFVKIWDKKGLSTVKKVVKI